MSHRWLVLLVLSACASARAADFNGDGFDDLAVGSLGSSTDDLYTGSVWVYFGSETGFDPGTYDLLEAADFGLNGGANSTLFGSAIAAGDFNGDGFDDLAIGAPGNPTSGHYSSGCVVVVPGSATGLDDAHATIWSRDTPGVSQKTGDVVGGTSQSFGGALAAGDFDGDGRDDLAIGVAHSSATVERIGGVHVLRGSKKGLTAKKDLFLTQDTKGVRDAGEAFDSFGTLLATGDLNTDGEDDLIVGALGETAALGLARGALSVFWGSKKGLTTKKNRFYSAHDLGDDAETAFQTAPLGAILEVADFDGDETNELLLGMPEFDVTAGRVMFVPVKNKEFDFVTAAIVTQDDIDPGEPSEDYDNFGGAGAVGDFNGDGKPDVAIGVPIETLGGITATGIVQVLFRGFNGFDTPSTNLSQASAGVPGDDAANDHFGAVLASGDYNGDGFDDLAISVLGKTVGMENQAGVVIVLNGSPTGIGGGILLSQPQGASAFDWFGGALSR